MLPVLPLLIALVGCGPAPRVESESVTEASWTPDSGREPIALTSGTPTGTGAGTPTGTTAGSPTDSGTVDTGEDSTCSYPEQSVSGVPVGGSCYSEEFHPECAADPLPEDCPTWWAFFDEQSYARLGCCHRADGTRRTRVTTYGAETTYQWYFSERAWVGYSRSLHLGTPSCCDGVDVYRVSAGDLACDELVEGEACWARPGSDSGPDPADERGGCSCASSGAPWPGALAWIAGLLLAGRRRSRMRR